MVSVQSNMQMHDELAALFSRTLTFNPEIQAPAPREEPKPESTPITYSISQHYTHSAHVTRPSSEPPHSDTAIAENILRTHGVDPSALTPSQIQLFKVAEAPQQMRLLELWSICPPTNNDIPALAWSSTSVEQEEHLARIRYERMNQQQTMSLDGTPVQTSDGKWAQSSEPDPEPYMFSGYAELMRRESEREARDSQPRTCAVSYTHATDPAYMGSGYTREQQQLDMATQYGALQQYGFVGDSDAMMDM